MNGFSDVFYQISFDRGHAAFQFGMTLSGMLTYALLLVGVTLIARSRVSFKLLLLFLPIGWMLDHLIPKFETPLSSITDGLIGRLPIGAITIIAMLLIGTLLIVISLLKKYRTPDRLIAGITLSVCAILSVSYHTLFINGMMMSTLSENQSIVQSAISLESNSREMLCRNQGWRCFEGDIGSNTEIFPTPLSNKMFQDYYSFYSSKYANGDFEFSSNMAIILDEIALSYAYKQKDGRYTLIIENSASQLAFNQAELLFNIMMNAAYTFWAILMGFVIYGHRKTPKK